MDGLYRHLATDGWMSNGVTDANAATASCARAFLVITPKSLSISAHAQLIKLSAYFPRYRSCFQVNVRPYSSTLLYTYTYLLLLVRCSVWHRKAYLQFRCVIHTIFNKIQNIRRQGRNDNLVYIAFTVVTFHPTSTLILYSNFFANNISLLHISYPIYTLRCHLSVLI